MSSAGLGRVLRVVVCAMDLDRYTELIRGLGHEVVGSYTDSMELVSTISQWEKTPNLIVTDIVDGELLGAIQVACANRSCKVPVLLFSDKVKDLIVCQALDIVFGVGVVPSPPDDREIFRAVLLVAITRFLKEEHWRLTAETAEQALEDAKVTHHAASILFDHKRLPTMEEAYRMLQVNAASRNDKLPEYANKVIEADEMMRPRNRKKK